MAQDFHGLTFVEYDEDGGETVYKILSRVEPTNSEKTYLIFCEDTDDETAEIFIEAAEVLPADDGGEALFEIESEEEWEMLEEVINTIMSLDDSAN
ncbi:hypothetical protein QI30_13325 [Kurthia sp. 3B1D]|uniref:Uncharacterized protein n=2 Tax=Kurthia TaxID=1649 RepID=A0A433RRY0_9BACL|nr:DUF1292 domain-containing protein [Kurthia sp. 3B1D]RUS54394.1 hypothetical protein QI30_13325 [Kurthia sp. 3B1D]HIX43868.1 DUF1292 domain-containing protein [Candidatus Kurthia intestinigallinarum]